MERSWRYLSERSFKLDGLHLVNFIRYAREGGGLTGRRERGRPSLQGNGRKEGSYSCMLLKSRQRDLPPYYAVFLCVKKGSWKKGEA